MFTTGSRHRQRYCQLLLLVILFAGTIATLWCYPLPITDRNGEQVGTTYGLFMFLNFDHYFRGTLPSRTRDVGVVPLVITSILFFWFLFAAGRIIRNTTPRDRCRYCGHRQHDTPRSLSNLCPECGELPNEHLAPWAFWRW